MGDLDKAPLHQDENDADIFTEAVSDEELEATGDKTCGCTYLPSFMSTKFDF